MASSVANARVLRRKLVDLSSEYWTVPSESSGTEFDLTVSRNAADLTQEELAAELESVSVSDRSTCVSCGLSFETFVEQRHHFSTDWHKFNARRQTKGRPALTAQEFDSLDRHETGSLGSISASEDEMSSDEDHDASGGAGPSGDSSLEARMRARVVSSLKVEFEDPTQERMFLLLYKAALPDQVSLASLERRGAWAVIMSGGGHFAASIWDKAGNVVKHKTFHRYTSRRKQGGSQAVADAQGGKRIRSAGATLRRHGEQQLQNEVRSLLTSWAGTFEGVQCVYIRANVREKRDLLVGWEGSPLGPLADEDRVRSIPFPTRRATLKEATRCYEELMSVSVSPTSVGEALAKADADAVAAKKATRPVAPKKAAVPVVQKEKGTAHLKQRSEKPEKPAVIAPVEEPEISVPPPPPVDEDLLQVVRACVEGNIESLRKFLTATDRSNAKDVIFHPGYFAEIEPLSSAHANGLTLGLVGVAAVSGSAASVTWLLDEGVQPSLGSSPYLSTKSKAARTAMRRHWGLHPDSGLDYAGAGVPGPLDDAGEAAAAEKRRRDRQKKKGRKDAREEKEKPPEVLAREARAAAAERRLLGDSLCAHCRKDISGRVPFERLTFRYCSTDCISQHKSKLAEDARRARAS